MRTVNVAPGGKEAGIVTFALKVVPLGPREQTIGTLTEVSAPNDSVATVAVSIANAT